MPSPPTVWNTLTGLDLKVGGEGMKGFYDKMLVDYANKFGKKFGARVEERKIPALDHDQEPPANEPWRESELQSVHSLPITPEMKQSVMTEGVQLFSQPASEESEGFKKWTKGARLIHAGDSLEGVKSGEPIVVEGFHGTTHNITTFDPKKASVENAFGQGIYITNTPEDAKHNYAGVGPDLKNRIEDRAEQILAEKFPEATYGNADYKRLMAQATRLATKELTEHKGATMKVYAKLDHPLVLGTESEPRWENTYEEDSEEPSGQLVDFALALRDVAEGYDGTKPQQVVDDLISHESLSASDALKKAAESEGIAYAEAPDGKLAASEIVREAV